MLSRAYSLVGSIHNKNFQIIYVNVTCGFHTSHSHLTVTRHSHTSQSRVTPTHHWPEIGLDRAPQRLRDRLHHQQLSAIKT